jgi:hypothetical protein
VLSLSALGAGDDEIDLPAAALATHQPLVPVGDGRLGAVALGQRGRVGLDLVPAIAAPHDEPHMGRGGAAERRRRPGVAVHRRLRRWRGGAYSGGKGAVVAADPACRGCPAVPVSPMRDRVKPSTLLASPNEPPLRACAASDRQTKPLDPTTLSCRLARVRNAPPNRRFAPGCLTLAKTSM